MDPGEPAQGLSTIVNTGIPDRPHVNAPCKSKQGIAPKDKIRQRVMIRMESDPFQKGAFQPWRAPRFGFYNGLHSRSSGRQNQDGCTMTDKYLHLRPSLRIRSNNYNKGI